MWPSRKHRGSAASRPASRPAVTLHVNQAARPAARPCAPAAQLTEYRLARLRRNRLADEDEGLKAVLRVGSIRRQSKVGRTCGRQAGGAGGGECAAQHQSSEAAAEAKRPNRAAPLSTRQAPSSHLQQVDALRLQLLRRQPQLVWHRHRVLCTGGIRAGMHYDQCVVPQQEKHDITMAALRCPPLLPQAAASRAHTPWHARPPHRTCGRSSRPCSGTMRAYTSGTARCTGRESMRHMAAARTSGRVSVRNTTCLVRDSVYSWRGRAGWVGAVSGRGAGVGCRPGGVAVCHAAGHGASLLLWLSPRATSAKLAAQ